MAFARRWLLRALRGGAEDRMSELRWQGVLGGPSAVEMKRLGEVCGYLKSNAARVRYDQYLSDGYPIAARVIDGASPHHVKGRMGRSGIRWTRPGAQAMLGVRSEFLNG